MSTTPPIFDAHFHIFDPRFPLVENQGYLPPAYTIADYLSQSGPLGVTGGAVVSGSFQAFDQGYLIAALAALPRVVIDHLGLTAAGLPVLLGLVERGVTVKTTGFGRVTLDVPAALRAIAAANPAALVFGTDLPSTRARRPFAAGDIDLVRDTLGEALARRVLFGNATALYTQQGQCR